MNLYFIILNILLLTATITTFEANDIVFLLLSQSTSYNSNLANISKNNLIQEAKDFMLSPPNIYLSHEDFPSAGDWTLFPIIPIITKRHSTKSKWIFICNERTNINLRNLLKTIEKYDSLEEIWFGHALRDREASIIHHFAFLDNPGIFLYPNMASGFVMSLRLLEKITQRIETSNAVDFSIDASHELAVFIWNDGAGSAFIDDSKFCITSDKNCATYVNTFSGCNSPVSAESVYFAVKTCKKYKNRVAIVKQTWANFTKHIEYFSDEADESIPTVLLGTPNTERGHCAKTIGILRYLAEKLNSLPYVKWIVITDDDTIISPGRLRELLACYKDEAKNFQLVLGERYGYRIRDIPSMGYNYVTGGGGMVFDKNVVFNLVNESNACRCPKPDTPDDMFIGVCLIERGVSIIHSPQFHQARPIDYAADYLSAKEAISFHKHWMVDPVQVYQQWFLKADKLLFKMPHEEL